MPLNIGLPKTFPWIVRATYRVVCLVVLGLPLIALSIVMIPTLLFAPSIMRLLNHAPTLFVLALIAIGIAAMIGQQLRDKSFRHAAINVLRHICTHVLYWALLLIPVSTVRRHRRIFGVVFLASTLLSFLAIPHLALVHSSTVRSRRIFYSAAKVINELTFDSAGDDSAQFFLSTTHGAYSLCDTFPAICDIHSAMSEFYAKSVKGDVPAQSERDKRGVSLLSQFVLTEPIVTNHAEAVRALFFWKLSTQAPLVAGRSHWTDRLDVFLTAASDWVDSHAVKAVCPYNDVDKLLLEAFANAKAYNATRRDPQSGAPPDYGAAVELLEGVLNGPPSSTFVKDRTLNNLIDVRLGAYWNNVTADSYQWSDSDRSYMLAKQSQFQSTIAQSPRAAFLVTTAQLSGTLAFDALISRSGDTLTDEHIAQIRTDIRDAAKHWLAAAACDPDIARSLDIAQLNGLSWLVLPESPYAGSISQDVWEQLRLGFVHAIRHDTLICDCFSLGDNNANE